MITHYSTSKSRGIVRPRLLGSKSQDCHHLLKIRPRCNSRTVQTPTTAPTSPFNFLDQESQFAWRRDDAGDNAAASLSHLARRTARMRRCQSVGTPNGQQQVNNGRADIVDNTVLNHVGASFDEDSSNRTYGPRYRSLSKCLLSRLPIAGDAARNMPKVSGVFYAPIPVLHSIKCTSMSNNALWSSALPKLPKDVELALRYLQEVIRSGKREMFAASSNALFDAALQFLGEIQCAEHQNANDSNNNRLSRLSDASLEMNNAYHPFLQFLSPLYEFLSWMDDQISQHLSESLDNSAKFGTTNCSAATTSAINEQNAKELSHFSERGLQLLKELELALRRLVTAPEKKRFTRAARMRERLGGNDVQLKFIDTGQLDDSDNTFDPVEQLLAHIGKGKSADHKPRFASIARPEEDPDENTNNENDSDSEDDSGVHVSEDREEHEEPEPPEPNVDQWIRRTRVTTNQTKVCVRIIKNDRNGITETAKRSSDAPHFLRLNIAPDGISPSSQQNEERVLTEKINEKGELFYPDTESSSTHDNILKLSENCEGKENHFKATTLACYVTLNDNLRFYEERQRRRVDYVFTNPVGGSTSAAGGSDCSVTTPDYVNLRQLLQASSDCHGDATILLPTQYLDDTDESDAERIPSKETITTSSTTTITSRTTRLAPSRAAPRVVKTTFRASGELPGLTCAEKIPSITNPPQALSSKDHILESLDVTPYLVLRAKEPFARPNEVRGGPKAALIVYATQNCSLLFQEAFIVTYRSFVTSAELIQNLIKRYLCMSSEKKTAYQKAARQTFSVLVRVVHELCSLELTRELVASITSFIYRLIQSGNYEFARILRRRLMEIIEEKSLIAHKMPYPSSSTDYCRMPSIFEFRSSALAKQITYLDAELLNRIEPTEMLWWAEKQDEKKSPNVVIFTEHFNRVSYWVRTQVIMQQDQRDREKYLLKFIKIMKQLRKLGNYNSYLAILSALDSGPIRRLDWPRNLRDQLAEHAEIMESSHSFRNYRTLLADTVPPCLPYIGLILQDLTFVHVGNPDYLFADKLNEDKTDGNATKLNQKNLLNYGKRWQQFAILDNIRRFKTWPYDIQRDDKILSAFNNFSDFLQEEETWERSFELKPRAQRQRQRQKISA